MGPPFSRACLPLDGGGVTSPRMANKGARLPGSINEALRLPNRMRYTISILVAETELERSS